MKILISLRTPHQIIPYIPSPFRYSRIQRYSSTGKKPTFFFTIIEGVKRLLKMDKSILNTNPALQQIIHQLGAAGNLHESLPV
jgi:hypothetical protein